MVEKNFIVFMKHKFHKQFVICIMLLHNIYCMVKLC